MTHSSKLNPKGGCWNLWSTAGWSTEQVITWAWKQCLTLVCVCILRDQSLNLCSLTLSPQCQNWGKLWDTQLVLHRISVGEITHIWWPPNVRREMFCENVLCCCSGSQNSGKQFTDIYCFFNKRVWGWARKRRDRGRGAGWLAFFTEGMDDRECGVAAHRKAGDREFGVDSVDGSGV